MAGIPIATGAEAAAAVVTVSAAAVATVRIGKKKFMELANFIKRVEKLPPNGSPILSVDKHRELCTANTEEIKRAFEASLDKVYKKIDDRFDAAVGLIIKK